MQPHSGLRVRQHERLQPFPRFCVAATRPSRHQHQQQQQQQQQPGGCATRSRSRLANAQGDTLKSLDSILGSQDELPREAGTSTPGDTLKSLDSILGSRDELPREGGTNAQGDTLKSLDNILGSRDELPQEQQQAEGSQQQGQQQAVSGSGPAAAAAVSGPRWVRGLLVPSWAWSAIREPRVVPLASNALYYLMLLVFVSYYAVQLGDGPEAGDDLIARLTNDHAAVAGGDTLRLFSAAFVAERVPALIVGLIALATLAGELESLLGYSTFWAVWCLVVLSGALADASLSSLPITAGPAAGVAGLAAALLAHHARNWRIEQLLQQAREGHIPRQWERLVDAYNAATTASNKAGGAATTSTTTTTSSSGGSSTSTSTSTSSIQRQASMASAASGGRVGVGDDDGDDLVETEIEAPVDFVGSVKVVVPREGKALITLGGAACSVVSALRDAFATDGPADWTGLVAGFAAGLVLGWCVCPVYELQVTPVDADEAKDGDSSSSSISSISGGEGGVGQRFLLPVLRDVRPPAARANAVLGYAAVLFAALGGWLASQGVFMG